MSKPTIRVLLVPVRAYRQLYLAFSEDEAFAFVARFNEDEAINPTGHMAVADMHNLCTKKGPNRPGAAPPERGEHQKHSGKAG